MHAAEMLREEVFAVEVVGRVVCRLLVFLRRSGVAVVEVGMRPRARRTLGRRSRDATAYIAPVDAGAEMLR